MRAPNWAVGMRGAGVQSRRSLRDNPPCFPGRGPDFPGRGAEGPDASVCPMRYAPSLPPPFDGVEEYASPQAARLWVGVPCSSTRTPLRAPPLTRVGVGEYASPLWSVGWSLQCSRRGYAPRGAPLWYGGVRAYPPPIYNASHALWGRELLRMGPRRGTLLCTCAHGRAGHGARGVTYWGTLLLMSPNWALRTRAGVRVRAVGH